MAGAHAASLFDVSDLVAVVTGASSGIGEHFARVLARCGCKVVCVARRAEKLEGLVKEITADGGVATALSLDVTRASSCAELVTQTVATYGRLDILVNNAGVAVGKPSQAQTEEDWDQVLDTNLKGMFFLSQAAAKAMDAQKPNGGSIINIGSVHGLRAGNSGGAAYDASKAAVVHMTKTLAMEWARRKIRVNCICPGYFRTEINSVMFEKPPADASDTQKAVFQAGEKLVSRIPFRRIGKLEELEGTLLLLAAPRAGSFMSGAAVVVDGAHICSAL